MSHSGKKIGTNTQLGHAGYDPLSFHGFVNPPIVRASTVLFPDAETLASENQKYTYATHGTPTTDALCAALTELEGAAGTVLVPSGLAAISVPLLTFLSAGDHVLITDSVYGPTRRFANEVLPRMGVAVEYYDPLIAGDIVSLFRPETKVVFLETPGSNTFEMQDVPAIVAVCKERAIVTMIDNTWATPLFFKPIGIGADIVIHAATKYFGGHSDVLMGTVSANEACWPKLNRGHMVLGMCVGSDDAYQILRGLRGMGRRLDTHQQSTLAIANWLEGHPKVEQVYHPALGGNPGHAIWRRDFSGSTSLFSFALPRGANPKSFLNALEIFGLGYSYGGYESLAVQVGLSDRIVRRPDFEMSIIRLQVGLEDVNDLIDDLDRGFVAAFT
ncbi:cystathionine beta-lyase (plasmid) [Nitratireductor rhodophyticola]|jgi:cystathionine beta-lyase|uniref:cystathionine beta-lyase n=1 Tax=Hyphomicrobiales TaxID=356 RepID=UPI001F31CC9B|nr:MULTISPECIES: cystathionine beta-lyase [Hyphomicrobiales]WPZ16475.1 cystathionine beta-lyase [Nitratireductor rhodophyticola]